MTPRRHHPSLTDAQQATLDFIRNYLKQNDMPPVLAEIARGLDFPHASTAQKCLQALERKGFVRLLPGKARGIHLQDASRPREGRFLTLPVLGRVAAGVPVGPDTLEGEAERHVRIDPELFRPRADYLLRVQGDSMIDDGILDGDLVGVRRQPDAENGQTVVARIDGEVTIKRLERRKGSIRLLPRNPAYAPIVVHTDVDDFAIEGLFVGLLRTA
ncbi:MAG: transcriptional repressor LexA [Rhodanobacteraceae bacterium]